MASLLVVILALLALLGLIYAASTFALYRKVVRLRKESVAALAAVNQSVGERFGVLIPESSSGWTDRDRDWNFVLFRGIEPRNAADIFCYAQIRAHYLMAEHCHLFVSIVITQRWYNAIVLLAQLGRLEATEYNIRQAKKLIEDRFASPERPGIVF